MPAARTFFVSVPVADVERSTTFYAQLGFEPDPAFSGEGGACLRIGDGASLMLLPHDRFLELSKLPLADPRTHVLSLWCFCVDSREEVDRVVDAALAQGATDADDLDDHGFMYSRAFFDLDGHGWQAMWIDPAAMGGGEPAAPDAAGTAA